MEWINNIAVTITAIGGAAATLLGFAVAVLKLAGSRKSLKAAVFLDGAKGFMLDLMQEAEKITGLTGEEKHKYVFDKIITLATGAGVEIKESEINKFINSVIGLSKSVNK